MLVHSPRSLFALCVLAFGAATACDGGGNSVPGPPGSPSGGSAGAASGNAATAGDSSSSVERTEIGTRVFDPETVLEYRITMDPALYEDLKAHGNDEVYRAVSLQVRGGDIAEDFAQVGLRYKGDYSLHHCWDEHGGVRSYNAECAKLSVKLKFSEYDENGRLYGLKRINLNAMSEDSTKLRERLAYSVFNEFGVLTARTAHAKLIINDEAPLLVLAVEAIDGRYTAQRYPSGGDGNLYKEVWPTSSLTESALLAQLKTNNDPQDAPDVSRFLEFGSAVSAATASTFEDDLAGFVDLDYLLRYMAVDRAFKNWDGITAFYWSDRPHNLYWYQDDDASATFVPIPWDHDKTMWEHDPYMDQTAYIADRQVPNWNVLPNTCSRISVWNSNGTITVMPPGCDNLLHLLALTQWDQFVAFGNELLETSLDYDAMNAKISAWAQQIAPIVDEDPLLSRSSWEAQVEDFRRILQQAVSEFEGHLQEGYVVEE